MDIKYIGYDCVYNNIIEQHMLEYNEGKKYSFFHLDIFRDRDLIISGDLCILKDILCHWKLQHIYTFLDYLVESKKFKYILIINCCGQIEDNTNIINNGCFHSLSCDFLPLKKI